jgi:hypothetical protein
MATTKPIEIPAIFKLAVILASGLTLLAFAVVIAICIFNRDTSTLAAIPEAQRQLFYTCNFCWQSGFGAIIGLIGGKLSGK